jgi:hypothetical protein
MLDPVVKVEGPAAVRAELLAEVAGVAMFQST